MPAESGRYPSGQRGQTVNLLAYAFGGSNPPLPTIVTRAAWPARLVGGLSPARVGRARVAEFAYAHVAQTAERVLGKDEVSGSSPDMGSTSIAP